MMERHRRHQELIYSERELTSEEKIDLAFLDRQCEESLKERLQQKKMSDLTVAEYRELFPQ